MFIDIDSDDLKYLDPHVIDFLILKDGTKIKVDPSYKEEKIEKDEINQKSNPQLKTKPKPKQNPKLKQNPKPNPKPKQIQNQKTQPSSSYQSLQQSQSQTLQKRRNINSNNNNIITTYTSPNSKYEYITIQRMPLKSQSFKTLPKPTSEPASVPASAPEPISVPIPLTVPRQSSFIIKEHQKTFQPIFHHSLPTKNHPKVIKKNIYYLRNSCNNSFVPKEIFVIKENINQNKSININFDFSNSNTNNRIIQRYENDEISSNDMG